MTSLWTVTVASLLVCMITVVDDIDVVQFLCLTRVFWSFKVSFAPYQSVSSAKALFISHLASGVCVFLCALGELVCRIINTDQFLVLIACRYESELSCRIMADHSYTTALPLAHVEYSYTLWLKKTTPSAADNNWVKFGVIFLRYFCFKWYFFLSNSHGRSKNANFIHFASFSSLFCQSGINKQIRLLTNEFFFGECTVLR